MQFNLTPIKILLAAIILLLAMGCDHQLQQSQNKASTYFIDTGDGNDNNNGTSAGSPWRSLRNIQQGMLKPGDSVRFRRGSEFVGPLYIYDSGSPGKPIVLTDYGDSSLPAPAFTNPVFEQGNYGNCIRVKGKFVIVERLYFHNTAAYKRGPYTPQSGWDTTVWEMGAVYIDKGANNCIVKNNEFYDCVVGIKSYGRKMTAEENYIHDCNRVLKEWGWGPIGIWFGEDEQEAKNNIIINYSVVDPRINWGPDGVGGGADGGAFEIDDARYAKTDISIHHNYTRDCQGFLEITWTDIQQHPLYKNFKIHHNVSDDYQQFVAIWNGTGCYIENNTIIRRKKNVNDWGVFNIAEDNSRNIIRNNIIVTEKDIPVFNTGLKFQKTPGTIIENNLYYAASGNLIIGKEGPGKQPVYGNPIFINYTNTTKATDLSIARKSIAKDKAVQLQYRDDFIGNPIPQGPAPDIGAFECIE